MILDLKYHSAHNGFCRVNYTAKGKRGQRLYYCMQLKERGEFGLYRQSRSGEPSYEIDQEHILAIDFPVGDTRIEQELTEYLSQY